MSARLQTGTNMQAPSCLHSGRLDMLQLEHVLMHWLHPSP
jgi:hypothetical protein